MGNVSDREFGFFSEFDPRLNLTESFTGLGWEVLQIGKPGGGLPPVEIDFALAHPDHGIALIDLLQAHPQPVQRLRARLSAVGFAAAFPGHLPVIHRVIGIDELWRLTTSLDPAFRDEPPIGIAGRGWIARVQEALLLERAVMPPVVVPEPAPTVALLPSSPPDPPAAILPELPPEAPPAKPPPAPPPEPAPAVAPAPVAFEAQPLAPPDAPTVSTGRRRLWWLAAAVAAALGLTLPLTWPVAWRPAPVSPSAPQIDSGPISPRLPDPGPTNLGPTDTSRAEPAPLPDAGEAVPQPAGTAAAVPASPAEPHREAEILPAPALAAPSPPPSPRGPDPPTRPSLPPAEQIASLPPDSAEGPFAPDEAGMAPLLPDAPVLPLPMVAHPAAPPDLPAPSPAPEAAPGPAAPVTAAILPAEALRALGEQAPPTPLIGADLVPSFSPDAPTTAPPAPRLAPAVIEMLIARGDEMLARGDISAARLLYARAAAAGSAAAAEAMARSFEAAQLDRLGARGIRPDPEQARQWRQRSEEAR